MKTSPKTYLTQFKAPRTGGLNICFFFNTLITCLLERKRPPFYHMKSGDVLGDVLVSNNAITCPKYVNAGFLAKKETPVLTRVSVFIDEKLGFKHPHSEVTNGFERSLKVPVKPTITGLRLFVVDVLVDVFSINTTYQQPLKPP